MALKITLKPQERMVIGGAVLTNANGKLRSGDRKQDPYSQAKRHLVRRNG